MTKKYKVTLIYPRGSAMKAAGTHIHVYATNEQAAIEAALIFVHSAPYKCGIVCIVGYTEVE